MKINLDYIFKTLDGRPLKEEGHDFTMKKACINSLMMNVPNERIDGMEKVRRAVLAEDIYKAEKEIDLKIDDIKMLKDLIAQFGSPLVVKQAWDILDPKTKN